VTKVLDYAKVVPMKDFLSSTIVQALLCVAGGTALLILSTQFPTIADELKVSAGAVSTLWFKLPKAAQ
jgi:hypothetical protein